MWRRPRAMVLSVDHHPPEIGVHRRGRRRDPSAAVRHRWIDLCHLLRRSLDGALTRSHDGDMLMPRKAIKFDNQG